MENILLKYMTTRHDIHKKNVSSEGPVITISREFGCYATEIAEALAKEFSIADTPNVWYCITKEILEDAAASLKVKPEKIAHIFEAEEKGIMRDVIDSFAANSVVSDTNIKRTVQEVVLSYAQQGNTIIVGRAGCMISRNIPRALHFRLIAPFDWRVEQIASRHNMNTADAGKYVRENDKRRDAFMNFFRGNKPDAEIFDAIFNRQTLTVAEIVGAIKQLAINRQLIKP